MHIYSITLLTGAVWFAVFLARAALKVDEEATGFWSVLVCRFHENLFWCLAVLGLLSLFNFGVGLTYGQSAPLKELHNLDRWLADTASGLSAIIPPPWAMVGCALGLLVLFARFEAARLKGPDFVVARDGTVRAGRVLVGVSAWLPRVVIASTLIGTMSFLSGNVQTIRTAVDLRIAEATELAQDVTESASVIALEATVDDLLLEISRTEPVADDPWESLLDLDRALNLLERSVNTGGTKVPEHLRQSAERLLEHNRFEHRATSMRTEVRPRLKAAAYGDLWRTASVRDLRAARDGMRRYQENRASAVRNHGLPGELRAVFSGALAEAAAHKGGLQAARAVLAGTNPILGALFDAVSESVLERVRSVAEPRVRGIISEALAWTRGYAGAYAGGGISVRIQGVVNGTRGTLSPQAIGLDRVTELSIERQEASSLKGQIDSAVTPKPTSQSPAVTLTIPDPTTGTTNPVLQRYFEYLQRKQSRMSGSGQCEPGEELCYCVATRSGARRFVGCRLPSACKGRCR